MVCDSGGAVDTAAHDRRAHQDICQQHESELYGAYNQLKTGLDQQDALAVAKAATVSTRLFLKANWNPFGSDLLALSEAMGWGICCAHSGTVFGILLTDRQDVHRAWGACSRLVGEDALLGIYQLVPGGIRYV